VISISGGFGWLTLFEGINNISESWFLTGWIEGNTFLSLYALPLFSLSLLMLLATFLLILKAFEEDRMDYSAYAGIVCLFLIFTHFFDALVVYPVLVAYILVRYFVSKDLAELWKEAGHFGILFLLSCPAALYDLWASMVNPVFHEHAWKGAITLSPAMIWFLGGLGFVGILAVAGVILVLFDATQAEKMFWRRAFLVVWLLSVPFLIYLPISFQRRLVEGVHVPAAILATLGFFWLIKKLNLNMKVLTALLIIMVIPNSLYVLHKDMAYLKANSASRSMAGFLDRKVYEGMKWLEKNTKREDIIFCDYETGNYIPAVSGNTVFIGHSPQTIDFENKWAASRAFFNEATDDNLRSRILKASGAKYVFYGFKEASLGRFDPFSAPYLKQVYNDGEAAIYEVGF